MGKHIGTLFASVRKRGFKPAGPLFSVYYDKPFDPLWTTGFSSQSRVLRKYLTSRYYELGINALNTVYEIKWSWVEPLVENKDWTELERFLSTPNSLYFLKRDGEHLGRRGDLDCKLPGLEHAVFLVGILNKPAIRDRGWTVEFALPWKGLAALMDGRILPPTTGSSLKVMAYRAHHVRNEQEKAYTAVGWSWGPMGNDNIHIPERWNSLVLAD